MININKKIEKYKIQKMLEKDYSDGNWESMIDKVEDMIAQSYFDGYAFAKGESELVDSTVKSLGT